MPMAEGNGARPHAQTFYSPLLDIHSSQPTIISRGDAKQKKEDRGNVESH